MGENERITVQEAARLLGVGENYIRTNLKAKQGIFKNIGFAVKANHNYRYIIYKPRVVAFINGDKG